MTGIAFSRRARPRLVLPITSLVDVLLILLIFFMVTSTYLDLDMIPMAERAEAVAPRSSTGELAPAGNRPLLIRLDPSGVPMLFGRALGAAALERAVRSSRNAPVVVLPSSQAPLQAFVDLLGALSAAGAAQVSVVPLPARGPQ